MKQKKKAGSLQILWREFAFNRIWQAVWIIRKEINKGRSQEQTKVSRAEVAMMTMTTVTTSANKIGGLDSAGLC